MSETKTINPHIEQDGFFDKCLTVQNFGQVEGKLGRTRLAVTEKGGKLGLDIRKFNNKGRVAGGIFISDLEVLQGLYEAIKTSTDLCEFVVTGKIDFTKFEEEQK